MMGSDSQLGNNIRAFRKAYGETQEQLGEIINVAKNTVSSYESGDRVPDYETLSHIARHYTIPIEELLTRDFSNLPKIKANPDAILKNIELLFPIVSSETAVTDTHFQMAESRHRWMFGRISEHDFNSLDALDYISKKYEEAMKNPECVLEATVNMLGLLFLTSLGATVTPYVLKENPAVYEKAKEQNNRFYRKQVKTDTAEASCIFEPDYQMYLLDLIKTVKKSEKWYEIADYYLALRYLFQMVNEDLGFEYTTRIGTAMIQSLVEIDNPYAKACKACLSDAFL